MINERDLRQEERHQIEMDLEDHLFYLKKDLQDKQERPYNKPCEYGSSEQEFVRFLMGSRKD